MTDTIDTTTQPIANADGGSAGETVANCTIIRDYEDAYCKGFGNEVDTDTVYPCAALFLPDWGEYSGDLLTLTHTDAAALSAALAPPTTMIGDSHPLMAVANRVRRPGSLDRLEEGVKTYRSEIEAKESAALAPAPVADGWVEVGERLPEEYKEVLVAAKRGGIYMMEYRERANRDNAHWFHSDDSWFSDESDITHWRPLPAPPSGNEVEE